MRRAALLCALALMAAACSNNLDVAVELEPTATATPLPPTPTPAPEFSLEGFCALNQRFEDSTELELAFDVVTGEEVGDRRAAGAQINAAFDEFFDLAPPQVKDEVGQLRAAFAQIVQLVSSVPDGQVLPEEVAEQLFDRFIDPELEAAGEVVEDFTDEFCNR